MPFSSTLKTMSWRLWNSFSYTSTANWRDTSYQSGCFSERTEGFLQLILWHQLGLGRPVKRLELNRAGSFRDSMVGWAVEKDFPAECGGGGGWEAGRQSVQGCCSLQETTVGTLGKEGMSGRGEPAWWRIKNEKVSFIRQVSGNYSRLSGEQSCWSEFIFRRDFLGIVNFFFPECREAHRIARRWVWLKNMAVVVQRNGTKMKANLEEGTTKLINYIWCPEE